MASQRELAEQLFEAARDLKPAERAAFLDKECNGDPELKREVEALLSGDADADGFLQNPTRDFLGKTETVIGPYHLLELIGQAEWAKSGWPSRSSRCAAALPSSSSKPAWTPGGCGAFRV